MRLFLFGGSSRTESRLSTSGTRWSYSGAGGKPKCFGCGLRMTQPTRIGYTGCTCYQVLGQSLARKGKRKAMSIEYVYPVIEEFDGGKVILDEERDPILRPRFTTFVQVGDGLPVIVVAKVLLRVFQCLLFILGKSECGSGT